MESTQTVTDGKKVLRTKVWQLTMDAMISDLRTRVPDAKPTETSMRDLYSHAYHPNRSEGFFAKRIILVEGATEQYALPIYAEACGLALDPLNVSVVDCGGKGQMDRLYRVFNGLGIPCFLLFDFDKNNADAEVIKKSGALLALIEADGAVSDDIRIEDTYACFPETWEKTLGSQVPGIEDLTAEARQFFGLERGSGKPLIARYIARRLASHGREAIPKVVSEILKKATEVTWRKSCLQKPSP